MQNCPQCYFAVQDTWHYCPNCGAALALSMPAYVEFIGGPEDGRRVAITQPYTLLGRRDDNQVVIPNDRSVSRQHAMLSFMNGHFWIADLGSKLGTRLSGESLHATPRRVEYPLEDGDIITLGRTRLVFCLGDIGNQP